MGDSKKQYGPVICCGAAAVSLSNDPAEPSSIQGLVRAIRRFMTTEKGSSGNVSRQGRTADQPAMAAENILA